MKNQIVAMGVLKSLAALLLCLSALPVMAGYNMPVNRLPVAVVNPMAESSYRSVVSVSAGNLSGTVFSESYYSQPIWNRGSRADRVNMPISGQAMYSAKRMNTGTFTPLPSAGSRYAADVTGFQAISAVPRLNEGTIAPVLPFGENGGVSRRGITNPPDPDENDPNDPMGGKPNGTPIGDAVWFLLALVTAFAVYRRRKALRL